MAHVWTERDASDDDELAGFGLADIEEQRAILKEIERQQRLSRAVRSRDGEYEHETSSRSSSLHASGELLTQPALSAGEIEEQRAILFRRDEASSSWSSPHASAELQTQPSFSAGEIEEQRAILDQIDRRQRAAPQHDEVGRGRRDEKPERFAEPARRCRPFRSNGGGRDVPQRAEHSYVDLPKSRAPESIGYAEEKHRHGLLDTQPESWRRQQSEHTSRDRRQGSTRPIVSVSGSPTPTPKGNNPSSSKSPCASSRKRWVQRKQARSAVKPEPPKTAASSDANHNAQEESPPVSQRNNHAAAHDDNLVASPHSQHDSSFRLHNGQRVNVIDTRSSDPAVQSRKRAATCVGCERSFAVSRDCEVLYCPRCHTLTPLSMRKEAGAWCHD